MSRLTDAISWSAIDVTLILFAVFPDNTKSSYREPVKVTPPKVVRSYFLEDLDCTLQGRQCHEYDLVYDRVPSTLASIVTSWIEAMITGGAEFAWFGFEASFSFKYLLAEDVAEQIFAVGTDQGIHLALEDDLRTGAEWAARLRTLREELGL